MAENKMKILIVDDDDPIRGIYAEVFRQNGFEVEEAVDGMDGLDKATKNIPDVVFTGIVMPRMDGFALFEALKKNVATNNIPVVISSHMGREEDRRRAQEMGAKDFITRDMNTPNEAVEKIKAILNLAEYKLKISPTELDAARLVKDMHFNENLECASCGEKAILLVKLKDANAHEFSARFACPKCGKSQE